MDRYGNGLIPEMLLTEDEFRRGDSRMQAKRRDGVSCEQQVLPVLVPDSTAAWATKKLSHVRG